MIPIWAGWLVILGFNLLSAGAAINYPTIWYNWLQRYEPFTDQFGRICAKRPWLWYGTTGILLAWFLTSVVLAPWWARVIFAELTGFFGWLLPHIAEAACDPDNPPHLVRAFRWLEKMHYCVKCMPRKEKPDAYDRINATPRQAQLLEVPKCDHR
jgi:hypothetical protein